MGQGIDYNIDILHCCCSNVQFCVANQLFIFHLVAARILQHLVLDLVFFSIVFSIVILKSLVDDLSLVMAVNVIY